MAPLPLFTPVERAQVVGYWNAPGRYQMSVRTGKEGPWVVRLTPEASIWFRNYTRVLKPGTLPPTQSEVTPTNPTTVTERWENWVRAKLAYDRAIAQQNADAANVALGSTAAKQSTAAVPVFPGLMPPDLLAAVGNAPAFAVAVSPRQYTIQFDDGATINYSDHVAVGSPRYGYYRFAQGVNNYGLALRNWKAADLEALFNRAGFSPAERRVAQAVSRLEGGFASVNTYDTGFVSIGFIQFASLEDGGGSLGPVLKLQKQTRPADFQNDFRRFGIDVDDKSILLVIDPSTGAELRGPEANAKIIEDKRLPAVFQRAGESSVAFQLAQIQEAKRRFYPADDTFAIIINGRGLKGKVSDVIRSEAGMATLFDRKVNTGNIRVFGSTLSAWMTERGFTTLEQARAHERELVKRLKWRADFLSDTTLSQP
jgi:hypothetical protein